MKRLCVFYRNAGAWSGKPVEWIVCQACQREIKSGVLVLRGSESTNSRAVGLYTGDGNPEGQTLAADYVGAPTFAVGPEEGSPTKLRATKRVSVVEVLRPVYVKRKRS